MAATWVSIGEHIDNGAADDHDPADRHLGQLLETLAIPDWQRDALCREYPADLFFPTRGESSAEAKAICSRCLVADECAAYAAEIDDEVPLVGIWAGTSGRDRKRQRQARRVGLVA